ncbi:hypothetical protein KRP22_013538 [Phytophthora ramorum]|nr:RxLR effector protein PSR2 [Phytophthora ramorum]KAH7498993.1 RxLR effector protein PSR2 [Phytophthora ramorum]
MRLCQFLLVGCSILAGATSAVTTSNARSSALMKTARSTTLGGNEIPYQRFLRTQRSGDNDGEERGFDVSKLQTWLLPKGFQQKLEGWLQKGKPAKEVFDGLQLTKFGDELLVNPTFIAWVKYVDDLSAKYPGKAASTIPTLAAEYGDEALFKMLEAAMKVPSTQSLATKLRADQIEHWAVIGKPPGGVLKIFAAEKTASTKSIFADWVKYVDNFNVKHPDKQISQTSMLSTLTTQYGDEALLTILEAAKQAPGAYRLATKLRADQIEHWAVIGKPPGGVLKIFAAEKTASTKSTFADWVKYVDNFNVKHPDKQISQASMLSTLTTQYGDEALFKILEVAMTAPGTQSLATKLRADQIAHWAVSEKHPRDVLKIFAADKTPVAKSNFEDWAKYVDNFNIKYPDEQISQASMLSTLTTAYGDESLFKILEAAKQTPSTQSLASKLQADQIEHWVVSGKAPRDVLRMFANKGAGAKTDFVDWVKYVDNFNTKHPNEPISTASMVSSLANQYGDYDLFRILQEAKRSQSTESIATKLQAEQIQRLQSKNEHPSYVFKILRLHEAEAKELLSSPMLTTWLKYLDTFNTKNPNEKTTLGSAIRSHYDVKSVVSEAMKNPSTISLARRVKSENFQWNLQQKKLPADVFYDLMGYPRSFVRTNGAGESQIIMNADNFLVDPMFKTWARYLNAFNKKYPDDKTDMIKSLLLYYTDDTLSQVLITAKQVPSTEKMATNLQLSLLNKWARDKNPPAEVSKLLNVGSSDTLMKTYAKKYDWALKNVVDDNIEVLENLTKETWLKYLGDFDKKKRDASSTIAELTARYGDESLARMIEESKDNAGLLERAVHVLQTSQIKGWMDSKNSVDDVFNLLKLNDKGNMRLDNPLLKRTLQLFIIRFNKENPSAQTSIIETLRRNYGDEILSKILISGKGVRKTQATASSWQTKLLDKWLEAGTQPSVVFKWLQLKSSALDNTERQVYETYAMKFKTKYPAGRLE